MRISRSVLLVKITVRILKITFASVIGLGLSSLLISVQSGEKRSFDSAAYYRANCVECHGKGAEKKFEPALPESNMIDAITNAEKMETPTDMPAFSEKVVNIDVTKALS